MASYTCNEPIVPHQRHTVASARMWGPYHVIVLLCPGYTSICPATQLSALLVCILLFTNRETHFVLFQPYLHKGINMDDPAVFTAFLVRLNLTIIRQRNAVTTHLASTFQDFAVITDREIDTFVTNTSARNRNVANANAVIISDRAVQNLKAVLFELHDRRQCNAVPTAADLGAIDQVVLRSLRTSRQEALNDAKARESQSLPDMVVAKLNSTNWREFRLNVEESLSRIYGHNRIPLTYVIRAGVPGNYMDAFDTRIARLVACTIHIGDAYVHDNQTVYSLLVQYIGTYREAKAILDKFKRTKLGRAAWIDLRSLYESTSFKDNIASEALAALAVCHYSGDKPTFKMKNYHAIMSQSFNDLSDAGAAHELTDSQQIITFKRGLRCKEAIRCSTAADKYLRTLPAHEQTFINWYNSMNGDLNAFLTLSRKSHNDTGTFRQIGQIETGRGYRGGRGDRGRGGRFGRGGRYLGRGGFHPYRGGGAPFGRGQRGRGRGARGFGNTYDRPPNDPNRARFAPARFTPQLKVYAPMEFGTLTPMQKSVVLQHKINNGWIDHFTPPTGMTVDEVTGFAINNDNRAVSAVLGAPLPPPPTQGGLIPPNVPNTVAFQNHGTVIAPANGAGSAFGRNNGNASTGGGSTVSQVTINGQAYTQPIFDNRGNRLN